MSLISPAQVKRIEETLCQASVNGASPQRLIEIQESLFARFVALKEAAAKPAATAK